MYVTKSDILNAYELLWLLSLEICVQTFVYNRGILNGILRIHIDIISSTPPHLFEFFILFIDNTNIAVFMSMWNNFPPAFAWKTIQMIIIMTMTMIIITVVRINA